MKMRPELSKKNKYWLEKHRYYELKHFCLQYPHWRELYYTSDGVARTRLDDISSSKRNEFSDPTLKCVERREDYIERINLLEEVAYLTDPVIGKYVLRGVTTDTSYDILNARSEIPCGKDMYYDRYRRFFWILDKMRA